MKTERLERILLRPEEVAYALGISRSSAYQLIAAGELPSIKIAGLIRVPRESLEKLARGKRKRADMPR